MMQRDEHPGVNPAEETIQVGPVRVRCAARLWKIHFLLASPMHGAISQFGKLYRELFGGSALDAYRLLEGFDNKILQTFTIEVAGHLPGPNQRLHPLQR